MTSWPSTHVWRWCLARLAVTLGSIALCVAAPGPVVAQVPADIAVAKTRFVVGETITVQLGIPGDRSYGGGLSPAWVGVFASGASARDWVSAKDFGFDGLRGNQTFIFDTPDRTGRYELRLYAERFSAHSQRSIPIDIVFEPVPNAIALDKGAYAAGEPVRVVTRLPGGRTYRPNVLMKPWVGLFRAGASNPAQDWKEWRDFGDHNAAGERHFQFTAPIEPGHYEIRVFDGRSNEYVLGAANFLVGAPAPSATKTPDPCRRVTRTYPGAPANVRF